MKIGIMQPYFLPYIGYFQLMNAVDEFVIYDQIEYSKQSWINRNRILLNGRDSYITLPLKKDSDYLNIIERKLADIWPSERKKMLNRVSTAYKKAPNFDIAYPVIEKLVMFEESNLFKFILNSLNIIKEYLEIRTPFIIYSEMSIDHNLKAEESIVAICKTRNSNTYVNPIGGVKLYKKNYFKKNGIDLCFLKTNDFIYPQFNNVFIPSLSILDVIMFNSKKKIKDYLNLFYTLI